MQALRHLDKQFMVLPLFMLAMNSACYMIPALKTQTQTQSNTSVKIYQQQLPKKLPQYQILCDGKPDKNPSTSSG